MSDSPHRPRTTSDPLSRSLQPPADETPEQRTARLCAEDRARRISDAIDQQLEMEKNKVRKKQIKLLLLGQSESGKSTTLKQFQIMYSPTTFAEECMAWRPVIYLNLVRSVRYLLQGLSIQYARPASPVSPGRSCEPTSPPFNYSIFAQRLSPVLELEDTLIRQLTPDKGALYARQRNNTANRSQELVVHPNSNWKTSWGRRSLDEEPEPIEIVDHDDPVYVLNECKEDMIQLWNNPRVQDILRDRNLRLEETPGFYLNDIERITAFGYRPTGGEEDVLKARLKTVGITEHKFTIERYGIVGSSEKIDWTIWDLGGSRSQRHAWAQFFDDANAIIFLAPISVFDEVLAEDPTVNRLEDSLQLWKSICSNKLLASVGLVLFLNKCDLLRAKLEAGVRLADYMANYDRANDFETVSKFFERKFHALHKRFSVFPQRQLYIHRTSVIDTTTTTVIINSVKDAIFRAAMRDSQLL